MSRHRHASLLPLALVLAQICSLHLGSAVAKGVYPQVGPTALAGMRLLFSALIMWAIVRPSPRRLDGRQWRAVIALGLVLAAMNVAYFQAIRYLPIGIASTVELLGPLTLAIALSRRTRDLAAGLLALLGVLLLATPDGGLPAAGLLLAASAALCRAAYVVLSRRVGRRFPDASGLTLALAVGACALTPVAVLSGAPELAAHPGLLGVGLLVAVLSSLIPYALDMTVLRRVSVRTFGILLSLSPAVGAAVGALFLDEHLTSRQVLALALVVGATAWSIGASRDPRDADDHAPEPSHAPEPRGEDQCPICGRPGDFTWTLESQHRTTEGLVEYCTSPCGCLTVLVDGHLLRSVPAAKSLR
ncbi:EamA family transporter [Streptomyces sp. NPDC052236]|uniref:EamA family transporter n=1 Tax=Streptomyces sp. NPDC052236 TaxID=3365686 RepID=UPI0037D2EDB4